MFNHAIIDGYNTDAGSVVNVLQKFTGQTEAGFDGSIPANTTDELIDVAWPLVGLQSLLLSSNVNLTVKTNSSTAPAQTIALLANVPIIWGAGQGVTDPITAAVTSLYVTNATANAASFKVRALST